MILQKHPSLDQAASITKSVIGAAIDVHRDKGPGLLESIYQRAVKIQYKDLVFEDILRCDVIVDGCLLIELKSVSDILPIHKAQTLSYMKLMDLPLGLLINFNVDQLTRGVYRLKLPSSG